MPYVLAGSEGNRAPNPVFSPWHRDDRIEAGGDVKTALSPNLTLDLTVNTDFAEAEVDDQRVNLTRFPLFFPERRAFFVERAGTFEVKTGEVDLLFNSRRVGLTPDGLPVRLLGGARLVGRIGGWDLGFFDAHTGRTPSGERENLGVLRARRALWNGRSWAGLMLTSRLAPDSTQVALGADGELHLGGDDYLGFALAALAGDAGVGPDDGVLPRGALRLLAERRRNRGMWYRTGVSTTGSRYAPALGYVEREDAIQPLAEVGYGWVVSPAGHQLRGSVASAFAWRNAAGTLDGSTASAVLEYERPSGAVWTLDAHPPGGRPAGGVHAGAGRVGAGRAIRRRVRGAQVSSRRPARARWSAERCAAGSTTTAGSCRCCCRPSGAPRRISGFQRGSPARPAGVCGAGRAGLVARSRASGCSHRRTRGSRSARCCRPTAAPISPPRTCGCGMP